MEHWMRSRGYRLEVCLEMRGGDSVLIRFSWGHQLVEQRWLRVLYDSQDLDARVQCVMSLQCARI
jgi:hypothetical protein